MTSKEKDATRYLIQRLKAGYGEGCAGSDLDDFSKMYQNAAKDGKLSEAVMSSARCASCRAEETVKFLEEHLELLKDFS